MSKMKHLLMLLLLLCAASASAQDVIVKNDGSTVVCRVVEVSASEVVYKKWSDLNGSNYVMNRSDVQTINYENGKKVDSATSSGTSPQQSGQRRVSDQELLQMALGLDLDPNAHITLRHLKADYRYDSIRKKKLIGWIGAGTLITAGLIMVSCYDDDVYTTHDNHGYYHHDNYESTMLPGWILVGVGGTWGAAWLIPAYRQQRALRQSLSASIYQQEIQFGNGKSLMAGVDVIKDGQTHQNTFGLGLRYNF